MLDDVESELFSVLSQLSDHCMFSRKLITYKIKKMWKYISGVSNVVEEKKKEKAPKATCDQSKEYKKCESRTRKFSTKWQVGRPWLKNDEEKGMTCEWRAANEQTLMAQNVYRIKLNQIYRWLH